VVDADACLLYVDLSVDFLEEALPFPSAHLEWVGAAGFRHLVWKVLGAVIYVQLSAWVTWS